MFDLMVPDPMVPDPIVLELGDDFRLRCWRRGDEPALVRHANNRKVAAQLRDLFPQPYTPTDARRWVDHARDVDPQTNLAIVTPGDEAIGSVGLIVGTDIFRRTAEIGYWVAEPFWGRGIATRAVRVFSEDAFVRLDLLRLFAQVFAPNRASARVLEKAGYTLEGRLRNGAIKGGKVLDTLLYARVREDPAPGEETGQTRPTPPGG